MLGIKKEVLFKYLIICTCIVALIIFSLCGCSVDNQDQSSIQQQTNTTHSDASYTYEAVFLNNDEVTDLFKQVRGEDAPFKYVTKDFHVTTEFKPQAAHKNFYGSDIEVHIVAYKAGEIKTEGGETTHNDGFKVVLKSSNPQMQKLLDQYANKNLHITDSYDDGAKYTAYLDFSDGQTVDYTIYGKFGLANEKNEIILNNN